MPRWRRDAYLFVAAAAVAALSVVVFVLAQGAAFDLLAASLLIVGLAILVVALPGAKNGNGA